MANSSTVSSGDLATAAQYNNLRADVVDTSSGHLHDGTNGRGDGAFVLQVAVLPITIENSTDNASNQVMLLRGDNATRADGDEIYVSFNLDDDGGNTHEFARITAEAVDVSNGSEDGQIRFGVTVAGTMTDVFTINSSTGCATSMTLDVSGDLTLDADGGDILFKDGGTTFGSATNTSGNLIIKSGTTTALTFSGANATLAGDLTISGDDLYMATNTDAYILVADGTNYNPVAVSGDVTIANNGAVTAAAAQTNITSLLATDIKIGEDDQTKIDFEDANTINFYANNAKEMVLAENSLSPGTSDGTALGTTSLMWSDLFVASGGVLNFNNGDVTVTHSSNTLTVAGGTLAAAAITGTTIDASTDFTIGTTVITDDSIVMTPSTSDTVTIAGATNGVLNITTVDNAAAAANLNFIVDGAVDVDAAGAINLDAGSGIWTFEDAGTEVLRFTEGNSGDVTVKLVTNAKDLIFTDNGDAEGFRVLDAAAGVKVPGEVMTTKISYTDGDDAMTIADGGAVTFPVSIDVTGSAGIILENDETITNSTNGVIAFSGNITVPNAGTIGSAGDTDAIAIASDGVVTMNQIPVFSAGINVSGGTIAGTIATAAQTNITSLGTLTALSGGTGDLIWDTNLLSVDVSDSQVGIGVANALTKFHVRASDASASVASSEVIATFERNGHGYLQMLNTTSTEGGILFGDADDADIGSMVYKHSTNGFHFRTNATSNRFEIQDDGNIIGTHGTYHESSDQRVKKEIATISGALNKVAALRGVNFKWKDTDKGTALKMGLIAQETEAVVPEVVNTASDTFINADGEYVTVAEGATPPSGVTGIKAVNYQVLVGLLIEAIKELKTTVDAL